MDISFSSLAYLLIFLSISAAFGPFGFLSRSRAMLLHSVSQLLVSTSCSLTHSQHPTNPASSSYDSQKLFPLPATLVSVHPIGSPRRESVAVIGPRIQQFRYSSATEPKQRFSFKRWQLPAFIGYLHPSFHTGTHFKARSPLLDFFFLPIANPFKHIRAT